MRSKSTSRRSTTARARGWSSAARWVVGLVCGLLLTLVSAAPAHASTMPAQDASSGAAIAAHTARAAHSAVLTHQPTRDTRHRNPLESDDVWLDSDEDEDDDVSHDGPSRLTQLSVEEALGLRQSSAPQGSLAPDDRTPATQFLIDSVRRM